ncbi:MAG TPA: AI-2E family transporter [Nitratifractor sp.]|nr:AI-2E family transporter [Nitratifractor sp.]
MSRVAQLVLVFFLLALFAAYSIYKPFIMPIVVAILLAMATTNVTRAVTEYAESKRVATAIMTLLMIILILVPIAYIATTGIQYMTRFDFNSINTILEQTKTLVKDIPYIGQLAKEYLTLEKVAPFLQEISSYLGSVSSKGLNFIKDSVMVVVFYAFVVYNQDRINQFLAKITASSEAVGTHMLDEVSSTMEIVFYSIIVTAIFEGLLFGVFISFYGFDGLLLGFVYGMASLIPVIGGTIVWVPVSMLAWNKIDSTAAITIGIYSVVVISIIADTFIKPVIIKVIKEKLLKSPVKINELIIFFSIFAGMGSYGFWGMILGPAITAFLIATTKTYLEYNKSV